MHKITKPVGFTLLEIIVSLAVFIVVILLTGSIYSLSQKSYKKSSDLAELTQNNRVFLDRLSRELRQSVNIITTLPPTDSDPLNPPADQIIFEGNVTSKEAMDRVPEVWQRRVCALRRGLDACVN